MLTIILIFVSAYCKMFGYNGFIEDFNTAFAAFLLESLIEGFIYFVVCVRKYVGENR